MTDTPKKHPQAAAFDLPGGPAFPISLPGCGDNGCWGMSLRDWFAGMALSGLLQNLHVQGTFEYGINRNAKAAYDLADSMLEARKQNPETDA